MAFKKTKEIQKHLSAIESAKVFFEEMHEKKESEYDSRSEKWQDSDKGQDLQSDISVLESLKGSLEEAEGYAGDLFEEE